MESISERRLLLEYTAGRDCLPNGVRPKDILSRVVNDARIGFVNKREFCNKLLTKAVFHGNYDIVELLLIEAKDIVDVNHKADEDDVEMAETNTTYVGWTPLHLAANIVNRQITAQDKVTLCIDIIILLWKNGANPLTSCRIEGRDVSPADIKSDRSVVALLLRILMEVMAASLAAANLLNPVDDDHILLLGWACKCKHTEVAIRLIARVDDPNSILVKETCVLYWMGKETDLTNLDILDALYRKYPNLTQHVNSRTPNKDDDITYGYTPISLACKVNNDKFFQWVLRCFNNTLTVIDLYNTGLTGELPRRLFEFANLKVLNVSKNKLEGISEVNDCVAFECRELEKVVFSDNKFTFVTLKEFFLLPKLKELNFSENAIEALNLDGIEIHQIPIVKLNLSGNSIKDIPHQLFCLPHLEELNLDDNKIAELPEKMWISPRLYQLSVNNNLLTELPVSTGKDSVVDDDELFHSFDSTTSTYVSAKSQSHNSHFSQSYRETMMAPGEMIEIEEVDTRVQQGHGLHLTKLQLNKNKLKVIPPNLSCLAPHLQILLVADNKLNVTPCIRNLPQLLKRLDLSRNELTKFLEKTSAHNETHFPKICPISGHENCIHSSHNKLANLEYLNMSHNNIDNDVNTRHDVFLYYELLQLDLSNNQLKKFPDFALHQSSLLTLDISNNPGITVIPCELSKLEYLCSFKCDGISDPVVRVLNTLKIAEKLAYLRSRMIRVERNNSVKLMIVGMHGKGKTTLLDHLRADGNFQDSLFSNLRKIPTENTSDSVDVKIGKWSYCKYRNNPTDQYPEIQFYTWDCAGEEEYYSTHQWFLHSRTLYLVVWNMSDGDNGVYGLLPWLQGIHAKSPNSRVIIVGTHLDWISQSDRETSIRRYEQFIRQCFTNEQCPELPNYWPKIASIHFVGLLQQKYLDLNIRELRDDIYVTALNLAFPYDDLAMAIRTTPNMKMMEEQIPFGYKEFGEELINFAVRPYRERGIFPILNYSNLESIATSDQFDIRKEEVKAILLFLQSKGLLVHFEFANLSKYYFTDPEWLNSLFVLLVSKQSSITRHNPGFGHRTGLVQRNHLEEYLMKKKILKEHVKDFITLLENCHIVIPVEFNMLLVPALLDDDPPSLKLMLGTFPRPLTLGPIPEQPKHLSTAIAAAPPIHILSTRVVVRRLYVFYGIPIGFWPQLISHFYTEKVFFQIINKALSQCSENAGEEYAPRWTYSKRNIWLTVKNTTLLTVGVAGRDYMDMNQNTKYNKIDLTNLHYISKGRWMKSQFKFHSGVLIEVNDVAFIHKSNYNSKRTIKCVPEMFQHTAELLTFAVETIDKLVSEVFSQPTFLGDPTWVKELIPCPLCLGDEPVDKFDLPEAAKLQEQVCCCRKHHTIQDLSQEKNIIYYFHINQCLLKADTGDGIACPKHGYLQVDCLAPDLMFLDIPADKVYSPDSFSQHYGEMDKEKSGAFGNVFKDYQKNVTIKIIKSHSLSGDNVVESTYKSVRKEIDKLLYFKEHDNIVKILGIFSKPHGIVLELAPMGDLQSIIDKYRYRDNFICSTALLLTMQQISSALEYFHGQRIVHRNVKPSSIVVFSYPDENHVSANNPQKWNCESCLCVSGTKVLVKLSDFGIGVRVTAFRYPHNEDGYKAPEVVSIPNSDNEKVDIYSLGMILYVMLTLRNVPLKGVPNFGQLIAAGKRPKITSMDPVYPVIFYECIHHCWKQDYFKRPSAEEVSTQLQNSHSSPINKHTIVTFSSISTIAVVYANGVQCLWAVTECPVRRQDDPSVRSRLELTVIQQSHPSRLEFMSVGKLPSNIDDKICVCQLHRSAVVGYADKLAIYDASNKTLTTRYQPTACAKCTCELKCLEVYANNLTALFAGQSLGNVHLLSLEDNQHPDSWVKYCYELRGEVLETMKACWCETHVELWCSTGPDLIEILRFPVDVAECDHQQIQDNIISLPLTTTGLVVAIECCVADDHLLVFTMAEQASVVTCWDGHSKEIIRIVSLSENVTCIRVVEPNLYIGTESGDCMSVELQSVTRDPDQIMNVLPHSPLERYAHRGPVQALIAAHGTMGCQGNLIKVFLSPEGEDHHGNEFRQGVACSLVLSIGRGYSSPWNSEKDTEKDTDDPDKEEEEGDNNLCVLVHLV